MKLFAHRAVETGSRCGKRSAAAGSETHACRPTNSPSGPQPALVDDFLKRVQSNCEEKITFSC